MKSLLIILLMLVLAGCETTGTVRYDTFYYSDYYRYDPYYGYYGSRYDMYPYYYYRHYPPYAGRPRGDVNSAGNSKGYTSRNRKHK